MANTKGSALPAMTTPVGSDIIIAVDNPGGAPATQKVTFANAWTNYFMGRADSFYSALGHAHAPGDISGGTFADTLIAASNVTQHQAALSITESQISDLGSYITASSTDTLTNKSIAASQITSLAPSRQTGATYTLALSDVNKIVEMNNASANTVTIPTNATVAFAVGDIVNIIQYGAGATTVDGAVGVTVNGVSSGGAAIEAQYKGVSLHKTASDEWVMVGAHGVVA